MKHPLSMSEQFCSSLESNPDAELANALADLCLEHGFSNITYYSSTIPTEEGEEEVLITTYPNAWVLHYFAMQYEVVDPVLLAGSKSLLPVDWSELTTDDAASTRFFGEAREFGIGASGLTVPVRGVNGEQAMLSVNSECSTKEWKVYWKDKLPDLVYLSHLVHQNVAASCRKHSDLEQVILTSREAEVLRWAARGKTAWETAQILGLTEKTISFYIGNICAKLRVATKTQAVAKAVRDRKILF